MSTVPAAGTQRSPVGVVTAVAGRVESTVAAALSGRRDLVLVRRCADVAELLSVTEAGLAAVAVLSESFPGLDADVVDRVRLNDCTVLGVVDPDREGSERLRAWGVPVLVVDPSHDGAPASRPSSQPEAPTLAQAVLAAARPGAGPGPRASQPGDPGADVSGHRRSPEDGSVGPAHDDAPVEPDADESAGPLAAAPHVPPVGGYSASVPVAPAPPGAGAGTGATGSHAQVPDPRTATGTGTGTATGTGTGASTDLQRQRARRRRRRGDRPVGTATAVPEVPTTAPVVRDGRLVAVWGPAGAPGRTTVAVGVAAELAAGGAEVLLVDADTYAASVAQVVGLLDEAPGLVAAVRAGLDGRLEPATLARLAPTVTPRLRVLTGLTRAARWSELRPAGLEAVLATARRLVDHVVVDLAAPLEEDDELSYDTAAPRRNAAAVEVLRAADDVLVVGSADPVGLQRLVRGLQDLAVTAPDVRPQVVVNRVRADAVGRNPRLRVREALERFAGVVDPCLVPDDRQALDRALLAGRTLLEQAPGSPAREALRTLAAGLAQASGGPVAARARRRQATGR